MPDTSGPGHGGGGGGEEVHVRGIVYFGVGLAVTVTIVAGLMVLLFWYFEAREAALDPPPSPLGLPDTVRLPPTPRLQVSPYDELRRFQEADEQRLHEYGWIDEREGRVRIPIERAMELLAERGLPAREGAEPERPHGERPRASGDSSSGQVIRR